MVSQKNILDDLISIFDSALFCGTTGGITGRIYGSSNFSEGEIVETSPITKGIIDNGEVVQTSSGSRYFLSPESAVKMANMRAAMKDLNAAKPGSTITLTKQRKEREAQAAMDAVKKSQPRSTFSLFGLVNDETPKPEPSRKVARAPTPAPAPVEQVKTAPRGVPTMSRWRKNGDGSVSGIISGSPSFRDGERVTTSPIKRGKIAKFEVVTTGSGSRYFLS